MIGPPDGGIGVRFPVQEIVIIALVVVAVIFAIIIIYYLLKKRTEKRGRAKARQHDLIGVKRNKSIYTTSFASNLINTASDSNPVIKLENVTKYYGPNLAVDNVSLEVQEGEVIGLVGPNGAGKTTTILMIAKILRPTKGRILVRNKRGELQDINKRSRNLIKLGFLIDVPSFYRSMTAYQILRYSALLQNYPRDKINGRINELLKTFKLTDWKHEKVKTFSKGMNQKLGIIQALIHNPEIIVLDEPQTGLDPLARIDVRKTIKELQRQGKTIFVASHMLAEISEVCNKIALINFGEIVAFDSIDNLETSLRTSGLICKVLDPIAPQNLKPIITKLTNRLDSYLDHEIGVRISKIPITYDPQGRSFKIYYKGDKQTRAEILKILVKEFASDFSIISYSKPKKSSQLEQIYAELIAGENTLID